MITSLKERVIMIIAGGNHSLALTGNFVFILIKLIIILNRK